MRLGRSDLAGIFNHLVSVADNERGCVWKRLRHCCNQRTYRLPVAGLQVTSRKHQEASKRKIKPECKRQLKRPACDYGKGISTDLGTCAPRLPPNQKSKTNYIPDMLVKAPQKQLAYVLNVQQVDAEVFLSEKQQDLEHAFFTPFPWKPSLPRLLQRPTGLVRRTALIPVPEIIKVMAPWMAWPQAGWPLSECQTGGWFSLQARPSS